MDWDWQRKGYGHAKVIGRKKKEGTEELEEEYETINSVNLPVSEKVKLPRDDNEKIKILNEKVQEIDELFKKPWKRVMYASKRFYCTIKKIGI